MAKNNKKTEEIDEIDESAMLQSIYERDNGISSDNVKPQVQSAAPQETEQNETADKPKEPYRRKRNSVDYSTLFLGRNEFKARSCVYISQKVHNTISQIVKMISDRNITVGGYIDSILMEHLESHKNEITELYQSELKKKNNDCLIEF